MTTKGTNNFLTSTIEIHIIQKDHLLVLSAPNEQKNLEHV